VKSAGAGGGSLLDDLVRPRQHRRRDREAVGLGGLEVYYQSNFVGCSDEEVAEVPALDDLLHKHGAAHYYFSL
jgi:hypothetical protein